jgi:NAD(P)-dependent dehydrogenase (short-subunit alcohol dehydrogenase family)
MNRLADTTALITGGASGIGRATVDRFLAEGATVFAIDDKAPEDDGASGRLTWLCTDVTDFDAVRGAVATAARDGNLTVCVANAGTNLVQPFVAGSVEDWRRLLEVNVLGVMITLREAASHMLVAGRGGRLLATASVAAFQGEPFGSCYCASKGAVVSLIQALAVELAPHGIAANCVAPGLIDTDMSRRLRVPQGFPASQIPAGRIGRPEEVAGLYAYLASKEASFITGAVMRIDGGELMMSGWGGPVT